jgi:hypothetical protein
MKKLIENQEPKTEWELDGRGIQELSELKKRKQSINVLMEAIEPLSRQVALLEENFWAGLVDRLEIPKAHGELKIIGYKVMERK